MRRARLLLALGALVASGTGCSEDKSFARVSVLSAGAPIPEVARLRAYVTNDSHQDELLYPEEAGAPFTLDPHTAVSFSVSFPTSYSGSVTIEVEALDSAQRVLGYGKDTQPLRLRQIVDATVSVVTGAKRPAPGDGGVVDGGPVLACEPSAPAATCGANQTCVLSCGTNGSAAGLCIQAGTKQPGEVCTNNQECEPGSQCFEFACSNAGQPIRTCLRFCSEDAICGTDSLCNTTVPCGSFATAFRICSRPCDPVGNATVGCATGLQCFIFSGETTGCECASPSRVGGAGSPCNANDDCLPGLMCVAQGESKTCRPICRLDSPHCASGTCTRLVNPDYRVFGACL